METNVLFECIQRHTGIQLDNQKLYLVESRLRALMDEQGLKNYGELAAFLDNPSLEPFRDRVIERIATHETRFFRDESIFDALVVQIIPEWLEKNARGKEIAIWSAGCSTGQEAYSIAMIIVEKFPHLAGNVKILATDIAKETLERASSGVYTKFEIDRGVPLHYLARYFRNSSDTYQVVSSIKRMVEFRHQNLIRDSYPGLFDVVFCRNVMIYFNEPQRKIVLQNLIKSVRKDGVLIVGSAESIHDYVTDYVLRQLGLARYYEVNNSGVTMFKA